MTHYDPAAELIAQRAELARLRYVEQLAREMARMINAEVFLLGTDMDTPYSRSVLELAKTLGLLEAK